MEDLVKVVVDYPQGSSETGDFELIYTK